jgi:hypothetical protein
MIHYEIIEKLSKKMHSRHIELWAELEESGGSRKKDTAILKDYPTTKNDCFACEFIERIRKISGKLIPDCSKYCPIVWIPPDCKKHLIGRACEQPKSPYVKWADLTELHRVEKKKIAGFIKEMKWTNKFKHHL